MYQAHTHNSPRTNNVTIKGAIHPGLPIRTGLRLSTMSSCLRDRNPATLLILTGFTVET